MSPASKQRKRRTRGPDEPAAVAGRPGSAATATDPSLATETSPAPPATPPAAPAPTAAGPAPDRHEHLRWIPVAVLSGVLWFTACADFDIWPFAWFAMVPTLFAIERASTTRRAVLYGWLAGLVANAGGFYWIVGLLERFGHLHTAPAVFLFLLLCAYQAVVFLLFAWTTRVIRRRLDLPMALVAPVVMVAFELCVPFLFPWYLAITQAWNVHVIQIAELTGPLGVTALLMLVNGAIYDVATDRSRRLVVGGVTVAVVAAALAFGHLRIRQVGAARAAAPRIKVGVVQPNVSFDMKGVEKPEFAAQQLDDLQARSRELEAAGAELIVWTESSYPYNVSRAARGDFRPGDPRRIRDGFAAPLVLGAVTVPRRGEGEFPYNSALMLDRDGNFVARFDKIFLLMFGEYIPGLETFPQLRKVLPPTAGHFARGKEIVTFPFRTADGREWRLGPMICYEDILPAFGRKLAEKRPHLLVNITNDAWFGDTSEPWEHLALSVYRSVELRTDLVRAVNTGVSAFIDATGAVVEKSYAVDPTKDPRGADKLLGEVALMEGGHTVYAAVGDLFGYLNVAGTVGLLFWARRRRGRPVGPERR